MTKDRIYALQWFHDRGEVGWFAYAENPPSERMRKPYAQGWVPDQAELQPPDRGIPQVAEMVKAA